MGIFPNAVPAAYVDAPVGGSVTKNSEYQREQYDRAASDIERILDNMAEKAACEELESERIRELNEAAQSISYGDIHSGVNIRVNRIASVDPELVEQYEDFAAQVEQWEEVGKLSEEEYQRYLADKSIPNMIEKGLSDTYWECYWESVSETAHTLLREYLAQNAHSDTKNGR